VLDRYCEQAPTLADATARWEDAMVPYAMMAGAVVGQGDKSAATRRE
jgi:hypothetical protein